ncbi:MFS transporter [Amycolatopsis methanolica]|nr:MFS transporter [Amycolatopsis methanolica]
MTSGLGAERMQSFGWRIPFLLAIPLGITGLYIRRRISDTPDFTRLQEEGGLARNLHEQGAALRQGRRPPGDRGEPRGDLRGDPVHGSPLGQIGRKKVIAGAAIAMALAGVPCYLLIGTGNVALAMVGASVMAVIFAGHTGVIHILLVELFPIRVRYSAYGLGYHITSAVFGGTAPLLMTFLIGQTRDVRTPAYYAVLTALGTLIAVPRVRNRAHEPLHDA